MTTKISHDLLALLSAKAHKFSYYQILRLLNFLPSRNKTEILFNTMIASGFPASDVANVRLLGFQEENNQEKIIITTQFLNILSPSGILPSHYTQLVLRQIHDKNTGLHDFFDIFHQRLLKLLYAAWAKSRFYIQYEQSVIDKRIDPFRELLCFLTGNNPSSNISSLSNINPLINTYYSGYFAQQRRSATALSHMLSYYFDVAVHINSLQGRWIVLPDKLQSRLGSSDNHSNNKLGSHATVGNRLWSCQHNIRIKLGPLTPQKSTTLLPPNPNFRKLCSLIRSYLGASYDFDIEIELTHDAVIQWQLNSSSLHYLGLTTWLTKPTVDTKPYTMIFEEKSYDRK